MEAEGWAVERSVLQLARAAAMAGTCWGSCAVGVEEMRKVRARSDASSVATGGMALSSVSSALVPERPCGDRVSARFKAHGPSGQEKLLPAENWSGRGTLASIVTPQRSPGIAHSPAVPLVDCFIERRRHPLDHNGGGYFRPGSCQLSLDDGSLPQHNRPKKATRPCATSSNWTTPAVLAAGARSLSCAERLRSMRRTENVRRRRDILFYRPG